MGSMLTRWITVLEVSVNTNNGVERKNRDFKHEFLKQFKEKSLSGMLTVLIDQFLSETYNRYNPKPFFSTL